MHPPEGVMLEPLFTAPFCVIARKGHPLAHESDLLALRKARWLLPESPMGYYQQLQNELIHFYRRCRLPAAHRLGHCRFADGTGIRLFDHRRARHEPAAAAWRKLVTLPVSTLPAAQYCAVWSQNRRSPPMPGCFSIGCEAPVSATR